MKEYWDKVCPEPHAIVSDEVVDAAEGDADEVLRTWVEKLKTLPRCVEITGTQIWNIWCVPLADSVTPINTGVQALILMVASALAHRIFGSKRVLAIWDSLKKSPVITGFRWSQLIEDGFVKNRQYFTHTSWLRDFFTSPAYPYDVIPGLLVLHIRRGDFEEHCMHFARWGSQWNGFNQFPELPDQFVPPSGSGNGQFTEEGKDIYLRHCFPDIEQIVARVAEVRATPAGHGLKDVYIMTNGKQSWIEDLEKELAKLGGWDKIASSKDLQLSWEQQFVAQSIDMLIGQRAQVIIGNGVRRICLLVSSGHVLGASRADRLSFVWFFDTVLELDVEYRDVANGEGYPCRYEQVLVDFVSLLLVLVRSSQCRAFGIISGFLLGLGLPLVACYSPTRIHVLRLPWYQRNYACFEPRSV